ncbi:UDP-glucuronic acid/UDP-N-acetylgalactosamine transporter [Fasciola hepatica]|uniref:UDP-glucuronic acid/UDP-N-acetylgalactosamine transporter n=1 Tax=Fasciola hepatica TaxID=6192 RepID=A0A4E0RN44_FASHE|nr:UDP-glucuronic acid/UDP-N-acetylgalactosamine transporter [Fasciola hepatica]
MLFSLPMFSALRRLSNLFIMVGEKVILGVSRPFSVYLSVVVMVLGAIVAVIGDLTFDLLGYAYVFTNNFSTAAKALLTKSLLRDQGFSSLELLYYNSGLMVPALLIIVVLQTDLYQNVLITYAGMFVGGDYLYSPLNFSGVTISALGAVLYVVLMYKHNHSKQSSSRDAITTLLSESNGQTNKQ